MTLPLVGPLLDNNILILILVLLNMFPLIYIWNHGDVYQYAMRRKQGILIVVDLLNPFLLKN